MSQVTRLLFELTGGDRSVVDAIMPLVYDELRARASARLRGDQLNDSVSPTLLVNETYLRLAGQEGNDWRNRAHFMAIAATTMRRILVEHARKRSAKKRGGGEFNITFNEEHHSRAMGSDKLIALDIALEELRKCSRRQVLIIEYWFFAGLTHKEIAEVLAVSIPTVRKDWRMARAWLASQLRD